MILFPMTAVIGGLVTAYIAVTTSDGLVVDDYYKRGKAINRDLARDRAAARYGMSSSLSIDMQDNRAQIELASVAEIRPGEMQLSILHPTRAGHDQVVRLTPISASTYRGGVMELADGHWYLQLEADDWRLSGTMTVPLEGPVLLSPVE